MGSENNCKIVVEVQMSLWHNDFSSSVYIHKMELLQNQLNKWVKTFEFEKEKVKYLYNHKKENIKARHFSPQNTSAFITSCSKTSYLSNHKNIKWVYLEIKSLDITLKSIKVSITSKQC